MSRSGGAHPGAGLCSTCRHRRLVVNRRGSLFTLCRRSETDARFPRYPRIPVVRCDGYEAGGEDSWEEAREDEGQASGGPGAAGEAPGTADDLDP